ncbi:hypothetical protein LIA77_07809 [Sarocladium implicatum]|nr:hypothetical protein LIA77_07809 [Sarocladium implicatum]
MVIGLTHHNGRGGAAVIAQLMTLFVALASRRCTGTPSHLPQVKARLGRVTGSQHHPRCQQAASSPANVVHEAVSNRELSNCAILLNPLVSSSRGHPPTTRQPIDVGWPQPRSEGSLFAPPLILVLPRHQCDPL